MGLIVRTAHKHGSPHLIGMGGMVTTLRWQRMLAKELRRIFPDAMLVSGAGLATEFRAGLFNWIPELDAIVHSEADDVILQVGQDALLSHKIGRGLLNLLEPKVYAGDRPADLDALPLPAWDLLAADVDGFPVLETYIKNQIWGLEANNSSATPFKMTRSLNTVSSRGCPYACKFCFRGAQGEREYGVRTAASLTHEAMYLHERYGIDFLGVLDDNCLVQAKRLEDMVPTLGRFCRDSGMRWGTHGRLDEAADLRPNGSGGFVRAARRRTQALAESGCVYVGFGAESASPAVLLAMGKGGFMLANGTENVGGYDLPKTMLEGYRNTVEAGLHGNCTWIMGYPGEGLRELQHSVAFIAWQKTLLNNPAAVNSRMFTATAYPGTEMFKNQKVQARLARGFGLSFDAAGEPICDNALLAYCLELDDATKVLKDKNGDDVYYGDMTMAQFEKCRNLVDAGKTEEILSL
ncbi:MAG: radical SAM protein [Sphingomonadales bacterium]|nr:radical SAM protein [Sphingomonadaceae bacterium]MBS3930427.1 radical SAM protein [Sphingomonadales bacterium]